MNFCEMTHTHKIYVINFMFTLIFMLLHNFMSLHNFNFITLFSITFYLCHEFANDLLIYFYVIFNKIIY